MAEVDYLDAVNVQLKFLGQFLDHLVVTQQDGVADAFSLRLGSSLQHRGMHGFGKYDALRMSGGSCVELLRQLGLLSQ